MKYFIAVFKKNGILENTYVRENSYSKTTPSSLKSTIQNLMRELGEHKSDFFQGQIIEFPKASPEHFVTERDVRYLDCWAFGNVHPENRLKITIRKSGIKPPLFSKIHEEITKTSSVEKSRIIDDRDFILVQENHLENLHRSNYTLIITTGIDMRLKNQAISSTHAKQLGKKLYDKGKRVTIIALPEKYSIYTFDANNLLPQEVLEDKFVEIIPFKIKRYLE